VKTLVANIFLPPYGKFMDDYLPVGAHSEVNRSSKNIEVALVLDTTGSMAGTRIADLKTAANSLIDIVVQPIQTPWYSKVAIVPYSMAVNLDTHAAAARGSIIGSTNITNATWTVGASKTMTGATKANPAVITSNAHGFANGDVIWISGVSGMTQLNNKAYIVANKATNTFQIKTLAGVLVSSSGYSTYSGNGTIRKCQTSDCSVVITAANHGLSNNDYVYINGVNGMTGLNDDTYLVGNVTTNTYTIGVNGASLGTYTSGGKSWCAQAGCTYYAFDNVYGDQVTQMVSTCVTERTGANAYTDVSPSTTAFGRNYPSTSNPCLANTVLPLSGDKATIKAGVNALTASGSTGGHIGVGWGWYTLSPNFNSLWPSQGAGAYDPTKTLKAVVIMTDGEYNSAYCNGVISRDSTTGSGATTAHIDCDAPNGTAYVQTTALCTAMKAAGVIVYTVGFQVVDDDRARAIVNGCATDAAHVYLANTGGDLASAFAAIGRDISQLRISR